MRDLLLAITIGLISSLFSSEVYSQEWGSASEAAQNFNAKFDNDEINGIYDQFAGSYMRAKVTRSGFVSQLSVTRSQLGGAPQKRTLILQSSGQDPTTEHSYVSFRYEVKFPVAYVYEDLSLTQEKPGEWKLYGIFFNQVPIH
ncbi:DUF4019 domain-containing protein [Paraburkholderia fungorum]|uniref:DUF4019 domain-containing protein n=1 Tax=Paraburkholderia fungorum TaxID=134537 RepID=UPI0038B764A8